MAAFDVRSGRKLWSVPESLWSTPLVVRPQGDFIALPDLSSGPGLLFVDARSGREVARVPGHEYGIFSMAISADGSRIVSGGYDGHVLVWDAVTHEMVRDIDVGGKSVSAVALSADGTTLWSAIADPQVIRTWDLGGDETFIKRLPDVPSARAAMEGGGDVISEVDPAGTKTANLQNADEPTPTRLWFVDLVKENLDQRRHRAAAVGDRPGAGSPSTAAVSRSATAPAWSSSTTQGPVLRCCGAPCCRTW